MKNCHVNELSEKLVIVPYNKVEAGYWSASNDIEVLNINDSMELINAVILKQLDKTIIGVPTPTDFSNKNKDEFYNKLGFNSWNAFFKKSSFYSITILFDNEFYEIIPYEKSKNHKSFSTSENIEKIILNNDEAHKIAEIVLNIFKLEILD
ncbi:MAG: hypothetical protein QG635_748 [Bacteroidota bacterium]|nr:hypothetical protein [Bacteroidota bacterium]